MRIEPNPSSRRAALVEVRGLSLDTIEGRPLFRELSVSLGRDRVAVIGRNGAGKTTLLRLLAGECSTDRGSVLRRTRPMLVRQEPDLHQARLTARRLHQRAHLDRSSHHVLMRDLRALGLRSLRELAEADRLSRGEARKVLLLAAKLDRPELLLLDEPTEDLDEAGIAWLCRWLPRWDGGLMVVSHHRPVLRCFEHFFLIAESGCRYAPGTFDDLQRSLEQREEARQRQYVMNLNTLADQERHNERVCRRRQRKKNVGRLHELRRRTSRSRLNEKRSYAQQSQGRVAKIRDNRIAAARGWAKATRRALTVDLPLSQCVPELRVDECREVIRLEGVGSTMEGRCLFAQVDIRVGRDRLAIIGPNGAGKTTLLHTMLGQVQPTTGRATQALERIGSIAQGATDWMLDDSLLHQLQALGDAPLEDLAAQLWAHRFPLALAQRPLGSLSPGERVRAALICLFARAPVVDLLVLDEPTHSLDFVGLAALSATLNAWPGGLVVASHNREFLESIGIERTIVLDRHGGHQVG